MSGPRLLTLCIEDFGLIRRAQIEFAEGLTVFSGETGSGKTMLLGALAFALGARSSAADVRTGAARASVSVELELDEAQRASLALAGFELDPDEPAIVVREMNPAGKSSARINGRPAPAAALRELAESAIDFIGQHEQQRLLSPAYHLDVLDRFAGGEALSLRETIAQRHARAAGLAEELDSFEDAARRAAAGAEDAIFALREIDEVHPEPGDDDRLRARRDYLSEGERIAGALAAAHDAVAVREESAVDLTGEATAAVARVARLSPELGAIEKLLNGAQTALGEAAVAIAREQEKGEFDPAELETIAEQLDRIDRLKRRYGGSIEAVLLERERLGALLAGLESRGERAAELTAELSRERKALSEEAIRLGGLRRQAARALRSRVVEELRALAMPAARFEVAFSPLPEPGPRGVEGAAFEIAANGGEAPRPLGRVASGGELSRILLSLVVALSDRRDHTVLVFDEIDAGIGGATAVAVGERIAGLASGNQVACVTHLAQIASWADRHYSLQKIETGGATAIEVVLLSEQGAVEAEIARMLSGSAAKVALEHAGTLLQDARSRKHRPRARAVR